MASPLTDAISDALARSVGAGVTIETACAAAHVSREAWYEWLAIARTGRRPEGSLATPELYQRCLRMVDTLERVRAEHEAELVANISAAGSVVGRSGVPEWRAHAWYLEHARHTRERWGQHVQVEHQLPASPAELWASQATEQELLDAAGPEWRARLLGLPPPPPTPEPET